MGSCASKNAVADKASVLIPAYWWCEDENWDRFLRDVREVRLEGLTGEIEVIVNVNSGRCTNLSESVMELWKALIMRLEEAGVVVFGYVNLADIGQDHFEACSVQELQGRRPFAAVKDEIDVYKNELGVHGIFTDDVSHSGVNKDNVMAVTIYVTETCGLKAIHNPGQMSLDGDLVKAAWRSCYREGVDPGDDSPALGWPGVQKSKWAMILHHVPASVWRSYAEISRDSGYGVFYATDGGWDTYPSYMKSMLRNMLA